MLISGACACRPVSNCTGLHDKCGLDLNLRGMLLKQNEDSVIKVEVLFSESCWQYWDAGVSIRRKPGNPCRIHGKIVTTCRFQFVTMLLNVTDI